MTISVFSSGAAATDRRRSGGAARLPSGRLLLALGLSLAATLAACAPRPELGPVAAAPMPASASPGPASTAPKPPKEALPLEAAVLNLADALLARAELPPGGPQRRLVIDPLIDRATGAETTTTRAMSRQIAGAVRAGHPGYQLVPFTLASLDTSRAEARPLVLLGAITGVTDAGSLTNSTDQAPGAYRIWAVLADLGTGKVVAHETAWVRKEEVDTTTTAFHRDSPTWLDDPAAAAYLRVCAGNPGDPIDPAWRDGLGAEALIAAATTAYEASRPAEAKTLFDRARAAPNGAQLRTLNGQYLATSALGQADAAERAFGQLVDYGLERKRLAVKFLFRPGATEFWPDPAISGPYPMWLRQIADRTKADAGCLDVLGHASTTGRNEWNDRLSLLRAQAIRSRLVEDQPGLAARLKTEGFGASRPLIGTGRDDATDALDRRVEFEPRACRTSQS